MLAHGDELGRTQRGNNNVYAQDNDLAWIDWDLDAPRLALLEFTRALVHLRRDHPVLRRRRFFAGQPDDDGDSLLRDIAWFDPAGDTMKKEAWQAYHAKAVMVFLNGEAIGEPDPRGEPIVDDSFLVMFNASEADLSFTLPAANFGIRWTCVLDTDHNLDQGASIAAAATVTVSARSTVVLTRPAGGTSDAAPVPAVAETPADAPAEVELVTTVKVSTRKRRGRAGAAPAASTELDPPADTAGTPGPGTAGSTGTGPA